MSDERLDMLSEMARNRGLKLVRSRVRTPNKRRFGKAGLTDKNGKAVYGMDAKGPVGKPEDIENYLRNLGAQDWGASLDVAVLPRKRKPTKLREAANDREPAPKPPKAPKAWKFPKPPRPPKPPPKPVLKIRDAKSGDAPRVIELFRLLDTRIDESALRKNLDALKRAGESPLVATLGKEVVGVCGINVRVAIHRPAPIGRISILVVAKEAQGEGIGRMLLKAAEDGFRKRGCYLVEVTSNDRLPAAHAFYRHMGYERTSVRFEKRL